MLGAAVKVSASGDGESAVLPSIAWTGSGYAIAWTGLKGEDQLDVHLARVDPAGTPQGAAQQVSSSREMDLGARVAFSGSRIAVGWLRFNGQDQMSARFRFFDGAGTSVGAEVAVNDVLITGLPTLSTTAQGFAFGYSTLPSPSEIGPFTIARAMSVQPAPMRTGPTVPISMQPGPTTVPGPIVTSPSMIAVGWMDASGYTLAPCRGALAVWLIPEVYSGPVRRRCLRP